MHRRGYLFDKIVSHANLTAAHAAARKSKTWQDVVKKVDRDLDEMIPRLQADLELGLYKTGRYTTRKLVERGKERVIYRLPYWPDRIVQHAICQVLSPGWRASMIRHTYASIPGRGLADAARTLRKQLREHPEETVYCLKMDVRQFYPSIRHDKVKEVIRRGIKDPRVLALIDEIIDSVAVSAPGVGLPIGNYLSQWLSNLYLSEADWRFKQHYKVRFYHRYMDDIVVLGSSKERLHEIHADFAAWIAAEYGLTIKGDWQVFPVAARGVDFVGYRFFHDRTMLRRSILKRMHRRLSPERAKKSAGRYWAARRAAPSYNGWTRFGNTHRLNEQVVQPWMKEDHDAA